MKSHTLQERADFYAKAFPDWPAPRTDERWLDGMWILGNDYQNKSRLYGAYPPNYLKRVMAMFPDARNILHLFSGSLTKAQLDDLHGPDVTHTRFDINTDHGPDVIGDAEELSQLKEFNDFEPFDLVLADPPYSNEDAQRYGTIMIKRNKVFGQVVQILELGGHLVWLDQVLPMFRKVEMHLWGVIGVVRSTNHRFRVASMFQRVVESDAMNH